MTRPRVLHCIPSLAGGGAERQLAYLSRELDALGWDVHIASVHAGPSLRLFAGSGATLHLLDTSRSSKYDPRLLSRLIALMLRLHPAIVQTWMPKMDIAAGLAASLLDRHWIISERTSREWYPDNLRSRVREYIARWCDGVIANSLHGARCWSDPIAACVIQNAVPFDRIDSAPPAQDLPETAGKRVALFVGRFDSDKNPIGAVEAFAGATLESADSVAVMLGDGPLRNDVEQAIRSAGAGSRILMLGYTENVWSWMKRADVLLSLSRCEGQPNAVLEAMTAGCSLILSDIPAHREMLDVRSAYFVDRTDPVAAARAIREVMATGPGDRRKPVQTAARVVAQSAGQIASEYHAEYLRILGDARETRSFAVARP